MVASVNRADLDGIEPRPQFTRLFLGLRAPRNHRVGIDVAGVVDAVGEGVTRFKPGDGVFADLYPFQQGSFAEFASAPERALPADPGGHVVRGRPRRCRIPRPRDPGAAAPRRPHGPARRLGADRRRLGQRRPVRHPDREGARRGGDRRLQPRRRSTSCARSAPITCSTTPRWTTRATGERYDWILDTDSHHSILRCRRALQAGRRLRHARRDGVADPRLVDARPADLAGQRPQVPA